MPAQSGEDPVSAALQLTLTPMRYRTKMGEYNLPSSSSSSNNLGLDSRIMSSATEILSANIHYTVGDESYSPTSLYTKLKEKYTVLSTNNQVIDTCTNSTDTSSPAVTTTTSVVVSATSDNKKTEQLVLPTTLSQSVTNKSASTASLPTPNKVLYPPNLVCLGWKGSVPVGAGFVNLGNTCYLNSALQALLHVPAFVNWLQSDKIHISQCESINGLTHSECLICAMVKILHNTHKYTGTAIKPLNIYSKLKDICKHLVHGHQEDAHEFLRYLIEGMERSYLSIFNGMRLDSYSKETTPLNQIFGGYMRTEVSCLECGYVSTTFQHFQDLLLDIRQANSVEEALETYFSRERLGDGDQAYKCGQCKRRAAATKKFSVERPPNALCIQLKRFNAMGGKNNKHISVKQVLDMTRYIHQSRPPGGSLKYKLVSMVSHLGQSANCGHYTAIGQSAAGAYYHFDDSIVRPVPLQSVLNTNAYIIMYELVETSREKTSNNQIVVQTNGVNSMDTNKNLLSSSSTSSSTQPSVDKKISDDKQQVVQCLPKLIHSSPERSLKVSAENNSASPLPKKVNKNFVNSKDTFKNAGSSSSEVECSLVPYLSESSESESGCESTNQNVTSPATISLTVNNVKGKNVCRGKQEDRQDKENSIVKSDNVEKLKVSGTSGWRISLLKNDVHANESSSTSSTSGKWSVIRTQERESWKPESNGENDKNHSAAVSTTVTTVTSTKSSTTTANGSISANNTSNAGEHGEKMEPNKNASCNSSSPSSCSSPTNTLQSLLDMSHQGYGSTNVNSWNGTKSKMSKDIEKDRMQAKRHYDGYSDELDRGKIKKRRFHKNNNMENNANNSWNRVQDYQNRKNCWNNPLNGSSRQNFYRQYTYEKSKGHSHHHHPPYRGGGNYYRSGGGAGNNFSLAMMSPTVMYKKPHCT
uniref:Ubiquitin carboxyl-terminal hydrolase n=3 Tax=Triatoma infestans TaxID=30076 RepID=A0A023F002_TRIIF